MRISDWSSDVCSSDLQGDGRLEQRARGDLPVHAPFVLAPAALAFLPAVSDDRVPIAVGFLLTVGVDLKGKGLAMLEDGSAVEPDARSAEHGDLDRQNRAFLAARIFERSAVGGAGRAVRQGRGIERKGGG